MKRWARTTLAFGLIGGMATLVVSWWLAMTSRFTMGNQLSAGVSIAREGWDVSRWEATGALQLISLRQRSSRSMEWQSERHPAELIPFWSDLAVASDEYRNGSLALEVDLVRAYGWPLVSMYGRRSYGDSPEGRGAPREIAWLPLRPMWLGFAVDALLYAMLAFGLCRGATKFHRRILRKHLRLRRGLCPSCAYPLGLSPVCTECGEPVPGRPAAARGADTP